MLSWYDNARAGSCNDAQSMSVLAPCSTSGFVYAPVKPEGPPVFCLQEHATMNARGKLAADIVGYFFSVISPQTRDRGPFLIQQEVDGTKTVRLTIRPLHANASIGTPHHTVSANSRDEVGWLAPGLALRQAERQHSCRLSLYEHAGKTVLFAHQRCIQKIK